VGPISASYGALATGRVPGQLFSAQPRRATASFDRDADREVKPFANDPTREARLWAATVELLDSAT